MRRGATRCGVGVTYASSRLLTGRRVHPGWPRSPEKVGAGRQARGVLVALARTARCSPVREGRLPHREVPSHLPARRRDTCTPRYARASLAGVGRSGLGRWARALRRAGTVGGEGFVALADSSHWRPGRGFSPPLPHPPFSSKHCH